MVGIYLLFIKEYASAKTAAVTPEPQENTTFVVISFPKVFLNKKILDKKFRSLGIVGDNIVFTCGSSVTASVLGVAYSLINNKYMPTIYIGSWSEYGKIKWKDPKK